MPLSVLAKKFPYSQEYLSLLARQGKIDTHKKARNWLATEKSVTDYLSNLKKYNFKLGWCIKSATLTASAKQSRRSPGSRGVPWFEAARAKRGIAAHEGPERRAGKTRVEYQERNFNTLSPQALNQLKQSRRSPGSRGVPWFAAARAKRGIAAHEGPERRAGKTGVADGARTRDNRNHNPELYQLSYSHHQ